MLCKFLINAGYVGVEKEPRKLRQYDCGCGLLSLSHDSYEEHKKTCPKAVERLRTHGPDILFTDLAGNSIAIDVRVSNELAECHAGKSLADIFASAANEKKNKYGDLCAKHFRYVRNLTFNRLNLATINPSMPYRDESRPLAPL